MPGIIPPGTPAPMFPHGGNPQNDAAAFLVRMGYNLQGAHDPHFSAALQDWHSGTGSRNPIAWNKKMGLAPQIGPPPGVRGPVGPQNLKPASGAPDVVPHPKNVRPPVGVKGPVGIPDRTPPPPLTGTTNVSQTTIPLPPSKASVPPGMDPKQYLQYLIDPTSYAKSLVDAQYNPQIAALQRALGQNSGDKTAALKNVKDWWNQATGDFTAGVKDYNTTSGQAITNFDQANTAVLKSLGGGDAANSVEQAAQFARAGLTGNRDAEQAFNDRMKAVLAAAQAEGATDVQRGFNQQGADLRGQISDTIGARGKAYGSSLGDANQLRLQQLAAIQNMQSQQALLPYQIQDANLSNQQKGLDLTTTKAQFAQWLTDNAGGLSRQNATTLSAAMYNGLVDSQGHPRYTAAQATREADNILQGAKYDPSSPEFAKLRNLILQRLYPNLSFNSAGKPYPNKK